MSYYTRKKSPVYQFFSCSTSSSDSKESSDSLMPFIKKSKEKEEEEVPLEKSSFYGFDQLPKRIKIEKNQFLSKTLDHDDVFYQKSKEFLEIIEKSQNIIIYFDDEERTRPVQSTSRFEKEKLENFKEFFEPYIFTKFKYRKYNTKETESFCKLELIPKIAEKHIQLSSQQVKPSFIHYTLAKLVQKGIVKKIVTNSTNNQLLFAGVPKENLIELYGNSIIKICKNCRKEICVSECNSEFINNEIKESEYIEQETFEKIKETYNTCDLCIILDPKWLDTSFSNLSFKYSKTLISGIYTYGKGSLDLNMNQLFSFSNDFLIYLLLTKKIN